MKKYLEEIEKKIKTKEDLIFFLEEIDRAEILILKEPEKKLFQKLKNKICTDLLGVLKEIEQKEKQYQTPEKQVFFLHLLKKDLISLPKAKIEIAFEPVQSTLNKISEWFEKKLGKRVVLDIVINPKIVGGAKIEYNGKWRDFSLIKKIHEVKTHILSYV